MNRFVLEASEKTPLIDFNIDTGNIIFEGRSVPEHAKDYFSPVFDWLKELKRNAARLSTIKIHFKLDYFNTSSSKIILEILFELQKLHAIYSRVKVYWYYQKDDEDIKEAGIDYAELVHLPFQHVEY